MKWQHAFSFISVSTAALLLVMPSTVRATPPRDEHADKKRSIIDYSEKELYRFFPELKGLKFAETQQELPLILQKVGENESALLRNIPDLSSKEDVLQEQWKYDSGGSFRAFPLYHGRYSYLVLAHPEGGGVRLDEYRTDPKGKESAPGVGGGTC